MKPTALAERKLKSNGYWTKAMGKNDQNKIFLLCLENKDCEDLEPRKIYQVLPDEKASKEGFVGSPYKAVQVIKKRAITSRNVLILLGHGFGTLDVTY